jgi:hypothetical protein
MAWTQPTIVQSYAPSVGATWTEVYIDFPSGISPGTSGANQTWDLSNGFGAGGSDVLAFIAPASLPDGLGDYFPMSDVAIYFEDEDSTATFFKSETDGFYIDGIASNSVWVEPPFNYIDYDPDNLFIPFNFSFPEVRTNVSRSVITIDGGVPVQFRSTITSTHTADGYGTVITPAGTFNNVLRMESSVVSVDSVFADTNLDGVFEFIETEEPGPAEVSYFFLQNAEPLLVATMDLQEDQSTVGYFSYIVAGTSGIDENYKEPRIVIYPNPSQGNLSILTEWIGETSIRISNLDGKVFYREEFISNGSSYDISLEGISSGIYLIEIHTEEGITTTRLLVE